MIMLGIVKNQLVFVMGFGEKSIGFVMVGSMNLDFC